MILAGNIRRSSCRPRPIGALGHLCEQALRSVLEILESRSGNQDQLGVRFLDQERRADLEKLQAGERAAIILAESIGADIILFDERAATLNCQ